MGRKQGVILSYVLMIFEVLSTLLITPLLIRTLGQAEYGVYKLSASITAYLLLLDLGIGNATIRYISKYHASKDAKSEQNYFAVAMLFYSVIAVISMVGGAILIALFPSVFSKGLSAEEIILGQRLLAITAFNAAVTIGTTVYANIIIAYEKFSVSKGVPIAQIVLRMIGTVVMLKAGMGSIGIVSLQLLMTILFRGFFVLYVLFAIKLRPKLAGIKADFIKEIIAYSGWILIQMIATQINASMDQILIGAFVTDSTVIIAVYSVGVQIVQYFQSIGSSFTGVLMPGVVKFVQCTSSDDAICDEMVRIGRIVFMVLGLIWSGFLAFGFQFINLWAGAKNADAYYVAIILMSAYTIILTEAIGTQMLWAKNEHKEQALLKMGIVIANIILTIVLLRWKPLLGATIGTFVSLLVGDIFVMNFVFSKKLKISLKRYYKGLFDKLLPCVFITAALGLAINLLPFAGWLGLMVKISILCVLYMAFVWFFGANKYEKSLISSLLHFKKTV